jgi:SapC
MAQRQSAPKKTARAPKKAAAPALQPIKESQPMASAPPTSDLPMFYQGLVPLSSVDHASFKARPSERAPYFAQSHAVPLTIDEFVQCQRFHPIVFSSGPDPVPLALFGLNDGVNTAVEADGKLRGPTYVPAYVRRYPWMLAKLRPDSEEFSLCFDPSSEHVGAYEDGDALFTDGQPSEATRQILAFCEQFEQAAARTSQFVKDLTELGLLMDGEMNIQPEGQNQPSVYRGFQMVNEEKLRELRGDQLRKITQNGLLMLVMAHLFSLQLMRDLFQKQADLGLLRGPELA